MHLIGPPVAFVEVSAFDQDVIAFNPNRIALYRGNRRKMDGFSGADVELATMLWTGNAKAFLFAFT